MLGAQVAYVDPRGIDEQHENEGDFGNGVDHAVTDIQPQDVEAGFAEQQAQSEKEHRRRHRQGFEAPRDKAEGQ